MTGLNQLLIEIRKWHQQERSSALTRLFALGDLMIRAVINTGLPQEEIIRRIMEDLGDLAMARSSYCKAFLIAKTFKTKQRKVLITKAVSCDKCAVLAGERYNGRRRTNILAEISTGKMKAPWTGIATNRKAYIEHDATQCSVEPEISTDIFDHGEVNPEKLQDVILNLLCKAGERQFLLALEAAKERFKKRGMKSWE